MKNAIREARQLGLLTVEERAITGFRNDTNIVRIVSAEWLLGSGWRGAVIQFRLGRDKAQPLLRQGGGVKSVTSTPTKVLTLSESGEKRTPQKAAGGQRATSTKRLFENPRGRWTARAMR